MAVNTTVKVPAAAKAWSTLNPPNDLEGIAVFDPSPQSIPSVTMSFIGLSVQPPEAVTFKGAMPPGGVTLREQVGLSAYKNVAEAAQKRTSGRSLMQYFARSAIIPLESRRSFMSINTDLLDLESSCA
jgi:hypothetical protein